MNYDYYEDIDFEDCEKESRVLRFLYDTKMGHRVLKLAVKPRVSRAAGKVMDSKISKVFIKPTVKRNAMDLSECERTKYKSYNDFFTRSLKDGARRVDLNPKHLISPCDSMLSVYPVGKNSVFTIKDSDYSIEDLLENRELADEYRGGKCLIFRLTPTDYHHYCYIDAGTLGESSEISGEFHTVRNVALAHFNIYKRNTRSYTVMNTVNFGKVVQVEVGALAIGKITNHHSSCYEFKKGEEKGLFEYGGSTIVLLVKRGIVNIDEAIAKNSSAGKETKVLMGERVGVRV